VEGNGAGWWRETEGNGDSPEAAKCCRVPAKRGEEKGLGAALLDRAGDDRFCSVAALYDPKAFSLHSYP
jgi:hypothetical protein